MLTEEDCFGHAMMKTDSSMFPVSNVIAESDIENDISKIEAVEEEPERIYDAVALVNNDEYSRGITATAVNVMLLYRRCDCPPKLVVKSLLVSTMPAKACCGWFGLVF